MTWSEQAAAVDTADQTDEPAIEGGLPTRRAIPGLDHLIGALVIELGELGNDVAPDPRRPLILHVLAALLTIRAIVLAVRDSGD